MVRGFHGAVRGSWNVSVHRLSTRVSSRPRSGFASALRWSGRSRRGLCHRVCGSLRSSYLSRSRTARSRRWRPRRLCSTSSPPEGPRRNIHFSGLRALCRSLGSCAAAAYHGGRRTYASARAPASPATRRHDFRCRGRAESWRALSGVTRSMSLAPLWSLWCRHVGGQRCAPVSLASASSREFFRAASRSACGSPSDPRPGSRTSCTGPFTARGFARRARGGTGSSCRLFRVGPPSGPLLSVHVTRRRYARAVGTRRERGFASGGLRSRGGTPATRAAPRQLSLAPGSPRDAGRRRRRRRREGRKRERKKNVRQVSSATSTARSWR